MYSQYWQNNPPADKWATFDLLCNVSSFIVVHTKWRLSTATRFQRSNILHQAQMFQLNLLPTSQRMELLPKKHHRQNA
ncbi:unnamed protein product [Caenorhabditis auriculariae]|uniref:Uncharacterized protein n=1 Tax=Caenorhabditis auriculariae TaxID=2777116 RepID=A0A8S1H5T2_9PELO|nr:unnamed protein product [Caenorhabditis auriculariae]